MISPVKGVHGFRLLAIMAPAIGPGTFAAAADLIEITQAGAAELKKPPDIRGANAATIIRHRLYKNKTQLRKFLPYASCRQNRAKIIAKQDGE